jgi:hypothetical protein
MAAMYGLGFLNIIYPRIHFNDIRKTFSKTIWAFLMVERRWARPACGRTGLSACIFFAAGKKDTASIPRAFRMKTFSPL